VGKHPWHFKVDEDTSHADTESFVDGVRSHTWRQPAESFSGTGCFVLLVWTSSRSFPQVPAPREGEVGSHDKTSQGSSKEAEARSRDQKKARMAAITLKKVIDEYKETGEASIRPNRFLYNAGKISRISLSP
jgi:hypothetical protein